MQTCGIGGWRGSSPHYRGIGKHELEQALCLRTHASASKVDRKAIGQALQVRAVRLAKRHFDVRDDCISRGMRMVELNSAVKDRESRLAESIRETGAQSRPGTQILCIHA